MKVEIQRMIGPEHVAEVMDITRGKRTRDRMISVETWRKLLRTAFGVPHSPMRAVVYRIRVYDIPYYVAMHYRTHHVGVQFWISSQRTKGSRGEIPQGSLVDMIFDINANGLIDMAIARMCGKAAEETREVMEAIAREFYCSEDDYDSEMSSMLSAPCEVYGECFEMEKCSE